MDNPKETAHKPNLVRAVKRGFREAYDHLGYVALVTFAFFIFSVIALSVVTAFFRVVRPGMAGAFLFIPVALVIWLWAVGVFYYANRSVFHRQVSLGDTWIGIKRLLSPALWLFFIDSIITVFLVGDTLLLLLVAPKGLLALVLGLIFLYINLIWMMMLMYHIPLLCAQLEMESGPRARVILRKSYLLMADNPGFTVGLFLVIIAFAFLCALPAFVGMATVFLGAVAFLLTHALRELFIKYGIVEEEPDVIEDKPWSLPDSWRKRENSEESPPNAGGNTDPTIFLSD